MPNKILEERFLSFPRQIKKILPKIIVAKMECPLGKLFPASFAKAANR